MAPRMVDGSIGTEAALFRGSIPMSSTAASTPPSTRILMRAADGLRLVSATSNVPFESKSFLPDCRSIVARPTVTFAVLPVTRTAISASRMAGSVSTGFSVALATISTDRPSSGMGGPFGLNSGHVALAAITTRSTVPVGTCSTTQLRASVARKTGQIRLNAAIDMRVAATPKVSRGSMPE